VRALTGIVVNGVRLRSSFLVLLPDLDGLVALCGDHAHARPIKLNIVNACFTGKGTWLERRLERLEVVAAIPVVEVEHSVIGSTHQYIIIVDSKAVDYVVLMADRSQLVTFRAFPNPNFVRIDRTERIISGMESQSTHSLLVLSEDLNRLTHTDVPEADHLVVRTGDDLGLVRLR